MIRKTKITPKKITKKAPVVKPEKSLKAPKSQKNQEFKVGDIMPDFLVKDQDGNAHKLSDYRGNVVVLYFYPKDMTSGCTLEAQGFQEAWLQFTALGAMIFGISPDSEESHQKFCEKESISFPLFADTDHKIANTYGVWKEKSMYGKKYMGVSRETFVIDEEGKLMKHFTDVKPADHPQEVLQFIESNK